MYDVTSKFSSKIMDDMLLGLLHVMYVILVQHKLHNGTNSQLLGPSLLLYDEILQLRFSVHCIEKYKRGITTATHCIPLLMSSSVQRER